MEFRLQGIIWSLLIMSLAMALAMPLASSRSALFIFNFFFGFGDFFEIGNHKLIMVMNYNGDRSIDRSINHGRWIGGAAPDSGRA